VKQTPDCYLVVDDDVAFAAAVTRLVSRHGDVTTVYSAEEAKRAIPASGRWKAVFLDLDLADGTAFNVLDCFADRGEVVPAVIVTGGCHAGLDERARTVGVRVLSKPIDARDVQRFIDGVDPDAAQRSAA
jgi:DNA-binding NtrC family response regulator